jgi:hypothetical protein
MIPKGHFPRQADLDMLVLGVWFVGPIEGVLTKLGPTGISIAKEPEV